MLGCSGCFGRLYENPLNILHKYTTLYCFVPNTLPGILPFRRNIFLLGWPKWLFTRMKSDFFQLPPVIFRQMHANQGVAKILNPHYIHFLADLLPRG
jgi:hypothetical protein